MKVLSYRDLFPKKGVPYSRVHTDRLEAAGKFPKRIYLSENTVVWSEEEIDAWLEARAAERVSEPAGEPAPSPVKRGRGRPPQIITNEVDADPASLAASTRE